MNNQQLYLCRASRSWTTNNWVACFELEKSRLMIELSNLKAKQFSNNTNKKKDSMAWRIHFYTFFFFVLEYFSFSLITFFFWMKSPCTICVYVYVPRAKIWFNYLIELLKCIFFYCAVRSRSQCNDKLHLLCRFVVSNGKHAFLFIERVSALCMYCCGFFTMIYVICGIKIFWTVYFFIIWFFLLF